MPVALRYRYVDPIRLSETRGSEDIGENTLGRSRVVDDLAGYRHTTRKRRVADESGVAIHQHNLIELPVCKDVELANFVTMRAALIERRNPDNVNPERLEPRQELRVCDSCYVDKDALRRDSLDIQQAIHPDETLRHQVPRPINDAGESDRIHRDFRDYRNDGININQASNGVPLRKCESQCFVGACKSVIIDPGYWG
jgi:hypothetical protein